ncbi:BREX-1 system adenine-specific DNA-methyltransferase PglX [Rhodohalobacter sulfatireducens]|uniref:site-specific DNA-methyltransferase (adenine-specific) n=1 Tax=Rhodohalobacter sulfatireducens TaxID=2911366 RepID=A0ABS9KA79_9BACT|nr:BREX-1 system adenine-specific DNA-methyltransferase PglX [Rhodohalobacter sulfatireducens]MCG2587770.1 BREX-1 system adenine-specific DNA-methyltransferase PglX [Rhodohalobacter sulfatireducens]
MNTNKLKKFAQETRRKLLKQVNGKLEHVLNTDSSELRGKAQTVKELKKELDTLGREALVDKVAYTWFNRLVALRYMDARGYQPLEMAILTPQEGQVSPQILQEAMAGHIPGELKVNTQQVMDILDGRTSSSNPENEAYRRLLVASCNHLHSIFPFLFEAIDDYTELLLPDDLTSEFSIVQDVIDGMTDEDCHQVEILGWLYQFYISEKKDEVFASKGKVKKEEIPAATQLFTPRWIVEYMVQNTVGKLWVLNHPNSRLKEHMEYYIESKVTSEDVLTIDTPEELTLLDQACGSGHILVYGFELLYKIYEEEGYAPSDIPRLIIEHNLHGFEIDERAAQLAGLAILMKAREKQQRLFRKSEVPEPNITCFEDLTLSDEEIKNTLKSTGVDFSDELLHDLQNMQQATNFGSLIVPHASLQETQQAKTACEQAMDSADLFEKEKLEQLMIALETLKKLAVKVCCVVDNPPYMGSGNMNKELSEFVKANYSDSKSDLMTCFMECGLKGLEEKGILGMINQQNWMFLSSYKKIREKIIDDSFIDTLLHLGPRTFPEIGGEVVQNVSFTLLNTKKGKKGQFYRLVNFGSSSLKSSKTLEAIQNPNCGWYYNALQRDFEKIPGSPIGYWLSENEIKSFDNLNTLKEAISPCQGLATTNNSLFIRYWSEITYSDIDFEAQAEADTIKDQFTWFPVNKGGGFHKWFGKRELVIEFSNQGQRICDYIDNTPGVKVKSNGRVINRDKYFKTALEWNRIGSGYFSARFSPRGSIFETASVHGFPKDDDRFFVLAYLNSKVAFNFLSILSPTLTFQVGDVGRLPITVTKNEEVENLSKNNVAIAKKDWNSRETSWDFQQNELIRFNKEGGIDTLEDAYEHYRQYWTNKFFQLHQNEEELNRQFIEIYGLEEELTPEVPLDEITILQEELDSKKLKKKDSDLRRQKSEGRNPDLPFKDKEVFAQFISYAVGCMFGRYSLDKDGLILANQGETLEDYLKKVEKSKAEATFLPDDDNIIPVLDDEWFEDDIVFRFHEFLKTSFGEEHFQKNLAFIEEHITHNDIRKYFDKTFYTDHYKRYNKRPIYWKFSSPKGHFSVLIYMHRYTQDTLNNILNNYLREFVNKLKTRKEQMQHLENTGSASEKAQASKEIDKLNKMIADCQTYEREILYPLASERIEMDLDDGVLVNYNLFGKAVEEIKSVNDKKKKKKVKEFDWIDGGRIR